MGLSRSAYRPWDRDEKLGPPPWSPDDPRVRAWEAAHGHDVRLKCYPEFGCAVVELRAGRIEELTRHLLDVIEQGNVVLPGHRIVKDLRSVLDG